MANQYDISTYIQALEDARDDFSAAIKGLDVRQGIVDQADAIIALATEMNNDLNNAVEMSLAVPDTTLTQEGKPAEAQATGDGIRLKMDKNNPRGTGTLGMNLSENGSLGTYAAALGKGCIAETEASFAAGYISRVKLINGNGPDGAIALGDRVTANEHNLIALGCMNVENDGGDDKLLTIGNGHLSGVIVRQSNAMTLDWSGNAWFAGDIKVGGADYGTGSELAPKSWVTDQGYASDSALNGKVNTSDVSNDITTDASSTTKVPSVKAMKDYADSLTPSGAVDQTVIQGSTHAVAGGAVYTELNSKQAALTWDRTPTSGSSNPVTSDGIYHAISNGASVITGSFTLNSSLTGATVSFSRVKQIGDIVYVSLQIDLGEAIGSNSKLLGAISGVSNPAAMVTIVPCLAKASGTNDMHSAFATIGMSAVAVKSSDSSDQYVYVETCYQAATN